MNRIVESNRWDNMVAKSNYILLPNVTIFDAPRQSGKTTFLVHEFVDAYIDILTNNFDEPELNQWHLPWYIVPNRMMKRNVTGLIGPYVESKLIGDSEAIVDAITQSIVKRVLSNQDAHFKQDDFGWALPNTVYYVDEAYDLFSGTGHGIPSLYDLLNSAGTYIITTTQYAPEEEEK